MIIMCSSDIFLGLLAILFPPLPVWVKRGLCSADSFINILLCCLGFLPGLIHAWYIIAKFPDPEFDYQGPHDSEGGHIYVFVRDGGGNPAAQRVSQPKPHPPAKSNPNYGTTNNNNNNAGSSSAPPAARAQAPPLPLDAGEGSSDNPPPSYAQVVAGDHKVQTQE
ncbi:hypothetical protein B0H63DRAFT_467559 [Podospora didyma]|uniref:Plasma membrane proteolipid 3 n=1 Tax=Podospora didyma TaxID=330526 RepID=A0AAE0P0V8_9PEZI|nr:hypothetical protein B0H63DRAFT_467559 [Podospora didyma]